MTRCSVWMRVPGLSWVLKVDGAGEYAPRSRDDMTQQDWYDVSVEITAAGRPYMT